MAVTTIPWGDGTNDNIYLSRNASEGNQTVTVSSDANAGAARSKVVTFSANGASPVTLTVIQAAGGSVTPVFYDWLLFDGNAYIDTDIQPEQNSSYQVNLGGELNLAAQRLFRVSSSDGTYIFAYLSSETSASQRVIGIYYNSASAVASRNLLWGYPSYGFFLTPKGQGTGDSYSAFTKGSGSPNGNLVIGSNESHNGNPYSGAMGVFKIYDSSAEDAETFSQLSGFTPYKTLKPCTYNGQDGLWNDEEGKFYGNSAGSGTLTACSRSQVTPSSYDSNDKAYYSLGNASNAYAGYSSTSYCTMALVRGSQAESYVYFKFNTSAIPSDATILRVVCSIGLAKSSTNSNVIAKATAQLCSGTTTKGTATSITSNNRTMYRMDCGTWTRQELDDVRIKLYGKRGSSNANNNHIIYLYGATLQVFWK